VKSGEIILLPNFHHSLATEILQNCQQPSRSIHYQQQPSRKRFYSQFSSRQVQHDSDKNNSKEIMLLS